LVDVPGAGVGAAMVRVEVRRVRRRVVVVV